MSKIKWVLIVLSAIARHGIADVDIKVEFTRLSHPLALPLPHAKRVIRQVEGIYKRSGYRFKVTKIRTRPMEGPAPGTFEDQKQQLWYWRDKLKMRHDRIYHVIAPPILEGTIQYMGGLSPTGCTYRRGPSWSVSNVELHNDLGQYRFWQSVGAIAHEIGHNVGARHSALGLMRLNVLWDVSERYVPALATDSRRQIRRCLKDPK